MNESKLVIIQMNTIVKESEHKIPKYLEVSNQVFLFPDSNSESFAMVHSSGALEASLEMS